MFFVLWSRNKERYKQNLNLSLKYSPESEALLLTPIVHCVSHQFVTTCPPKIFQINHYQSVLIDLISIIQKLDLKSESTHALQILEFSSNIKWTLPRTKQTESFCPAVMKCLDILEKHSEVFVIFLTFFESFQTF